MRMTWTRACSALALALSATWSFSEPVLATDPPKLAKKGAGEQASESTVMRIPGHGHFPLNRQVNMGKGRSMMIEFPMELRDVMISDPEKVDAVVQTSNRVFLIAKAPGAANAFFFDSQGNQIMNLEINIGSDLSSLDGLLKRLVPGSNIKTELAGATIVLTGSVRTPADSIRAADIATQYAAANKGAIGASSATSTRTETGGVTTWQIQSQAKDDTKYKPVINMLSIEGEEQVMLKVSVAEINRTVLKQLGVNLGASITAGRFGVDFGTTNTFPLSGATLGALGKTGLVTQDALLDAAKQGQSLARCITVNDAVSPKYVGVSGLGGGYESGGSCFTQALRAMERDGLVRMLAEPTLTAVSGESARFLAGGEYPVPTSSANGFIGIEFKEYGVGVAFTPTVLSEGRISLKIDTQVSELSSDGNIVINGIGIPSLRKRSALSTLELPSGGSMVLAGLISDQTRQNIEGFPGLKDMPVLGTLFRSRDFQQSETELVVIVTPYMVRPTSRQNLARPDDGLAPASDLKANFLGHLNRVYGKGKTLPDGGLKGDHGFIVD
jgi:pilus assembly protein CpaC